MQDCVECQLHQLRQHVPVVVEGRNFRVGLTAVVGIAKRDTVRAAPQDDLYLRAATGALLAEDAVHMLQICAPSHLPIAHLADTADALVRLQQSVALGLSARTG